MAGAAGTLESRLIISAADKTGVVIDALAQKIEALEKKLAGFEKASATAGKVSTAGFDAAAKGAERLNRAVDRIGGRLRGVERLSAALGKIGKHASEAVKHMGALGGVTGGIGGAALIHKGVHASTSYDNAINQMRMAGFSGDEESEARALAAQISGKYRSLPQKNILDMLRSQRAITGSWEEAKHVAMDGARLAAIVQMRHPGSEPGEGMEFVNKAMELFNQTMDPSKHHAAMNSIAKAANTFGGTLSLEDWYQMALRSKGAASKLSTDFMFGTMPTLGSEMRGSGAGDSVYSFMQAVVGGKMKTSSVKTLAELGLVDMGKADITKTGAIKGLRPGGVKGWELAQSDPDKWVEQYLGPAIDKKGLTPEAADAAIMSAFSNGKAQQFVKMLFLQRAKLAKDRELMGKAEGLEASDKNQLRDPGTALTGFGSAFEGLLSAVTSPLLESAIPAINGLTDSLNRLSGWAKENPALATVGGLGAVAGTAAAGAAAGRWAIGSIGQALGLGGSEAGMLAEGAVAGGSSLPAIARFGLGRLALPLALGGALYDIAGYGQKGPYQPGQIATPRNMLQGLPSVDMGEVGAQLGRGASGEPIKAEITGSAEIKNTVEINFNESLFWTKVKSMVDGAIKGLNITSSGVGSSGKTMPDPATAAP